MQKILLYSLILFFYNLNANWFQSLHEIGAYAFYIKANDSTCKGDHVECDWSDDIFVLLENKSGNSLCDFESANFENTFAIKEKIKVVYQDSLNYKEFVQNVDGFRTRKRGLEKPQPLEVSEFLLLSVNSISKDVEPLKCILNIYTWNGPKRMQSDRVSGGIQSYKKNIIQTYYYTWSGLGSSGLQSEIVSFNLKKQKIQELKDDIESFIKQKEEENTKINLKNFNDILKFSLRDFSDIPQLNNVSIQQGPFETNAEYLDRISGLEDNKDKSFFFIKEKILNPNSYNAETSNWEIPIFERHSTNVDVSFYDGQNAFGASKQVTKRIGKTESIKIENKSLFSNFDSSFLEISLPMERSYARKNYEDLKFLTLYSFDNSPARLNKTYSRDYPSFDSPYDVDIENLEISMKLEAVAIKNIRTGTFEKIFFYNPPSLNNYKKDSIFSVMGLRYHKEQLYTVDISNNPKEYFRNKSNVAPQLNILGSPRKDKFIPSDTSLTNGVNVGICDWAKINQVLWIGPYLWTEDMVVFETDKGDNNIKCKQILFLDGTFITAETDDSVYLVGRF